MIDDVTKLDVVKEYMKCIDKKKGIPSLVLGSACDILNKKCNEILTRITDFNVRFSYSSVRGIDITTSKTIDNVQYDISADRASGFQKFILDIIMRVVFAEITKCSTPEILFIDEGFGCLDKNNFSTVCGTLGHFSRNFKSIFIISHLEEIQSYMHSNIKIKLNPDLTSCCQLGKVDTKIRVYEETLTDRKRAIDAQKQSIVDRKLDKIAEKNRKIEMVKVKSAEIGVDIFDAGEKKRFCRACKRTIRVVKNSLSNHVISKTHLSKMVQFLG